MWINVINTGINSSIIIQNRLKLITKKLLVSIVIDFQQSSSIMSSILSIFIAVIQFSCFDRFIISAKNVMDKQLALFSIKGKESTENFSLLEPI